MLAFLWRRKNTALRTQADLERLDEKVRQLQFHRRRISDSPDHDMTDEDFPETLDAMINLSVDHGAADKHRWEQKSRHLHV